MVTVRERTPADDPALARLFGEMQAFYGRSCPPAEFVLRDLATLPPGVTILVAELDGVVGFAVFSPIYPGPGLSSGLFLKELFVSSAFRRSGVGTALMRAVAAYAVRHGHKRVDWTADRYKPELHAYYQDLGALKQEDKVFFRLMDDALVALASEQP